MTIEEIRHRHSQGLNPQLPWGETIFRRDGTATSRQGGGVVGPMEAAGTLEPSDFEELVGTLEVEAFFELADFYGEPGLEGPVTTTSATGDDGAKTVTERGDAGPVNLHRIYEAISDIGGRVQWERQPTAI